MEEGKERTNEEIREYKLVSEKSLNKFNERINSLLEHHGFKVHGAPQITIGADGKTTYSQVMAKYLF